MKNGLGRAHLFGLGCRGRACQTQPMSTKGSASPGLIRRAPTPYVRNDGRTSYYTSRGVSVVTSPEQVLGEWYGRSIECGERILKWVEHVEGGPGGSREPPDNLEDPVATTRNIVLTVRVMAKAGHIVVLVLWACIYVTYLRIKYMLGFH